MTRKHDSDTGDLRDYQPLMDLVDLYADDLGGPIPESARKVIADRLGWVLSPAGMRKAASKYDRQHDPARNGVANKRQALMPFLPLLPVVERNANLQADSIASEDAELLAARFPHWSAWDELSPLQRRTAADEHDWQQDPSRRTGNSLGWKLMEIEELPVSNASDYEAKERLLSGTLTELAEFDAALRRDTVVEHASGQTQEPVPAGPSLSSDDVCEAFDKVGLSSLEWRKAIGKNLPDWLRGCRISKGRQGASPIQARWDPLKIAAALLRGASRTAGHVPVAKLDVAFRQRPLLKQFAQAWAELRADNPTWGE